MRLSTVALLSERPRQRAARIALLAVIAVAAVWLVDAAIDAFVIERHLWIVPGRSGPGQAWAPLLVDSLLEPEAIEVWKRILVAALLTAVFVLRQERERLHLLSSALAEAPDGVQLTDLTGRIAYSNRAVQEIYGFSADELLGKHVNSMNVDPEFASRVILPAIGQHGHWAGELEVKHKDGRTFPIWLKTALLVGAGGKPAAAVGVIRDIAERRRTEEALRTYASQLEEATRLKDLFADILRHDLLGPAATLRMAVDLMQKSELPPATQQLLARMGRSCARLTDLLEHAAKYAKISALEQLDLEALDLRRVLQEVVADFDAALLDEKKRISLRASGELPVRANPLVSEVFANLLSNAIKYGPEVSTVTVGVEEDREHWIVAVADHGEGIRDQDKERIFTRFERLDREGVKGTGLGLAIAKHIVELHRGRIWVDDNPGGGSVFRVALPKADAR